MLMYFQAKEESNQWPEQENVSVDRETCEESTNKWPVRIVLLNTKMCSGIKEQEWV